MGKFREYLEQKYGKDVVESGGYVEQNNSGYKYRKNNSSEHRQFFSFSFAKEFNEKELDEWNLNTKDSLGLRLNIDLKNNLYFYILIVSDEDGYNYDNLYSSKINFKKLSDIKIYTKLEEIKKILE